MKFMFASVATAFANSVLEHPINQEYPYKSPGGPYNSTPLGGLI